MRFSSLNTNSCQSAPRQLAAALSGTVTATEENYAPLSARAGAACPVSGTWQQANALNRYITEGDATRTGPNSDRWSSALQGQQRNDIGEGCDRGWHAPTWERSTKSSQIPCDTGVSTTVDRSSLRPVVPTTPTAARLGAPRSSRAVAFDIVDIAAAFTLRPLHPEDVRTWRTGLSN